MPALKELDNVEMVAFCDLIIERAEEATKKYGVEGAKCYEKYEDMLANEELDVVHVCTPNNAHAPASIAAMEAGCHVMCEKPMAKTVEQAQGSDRYFELEHEEMYAEPFGIPEPQKVLFIGWYPNGEVFRSGCCYVRGNGKIFYFQPGHETFPIYYDKNVQTVIKNAVRWAEPVFRAKELTCPMVAPPGKNN